MIAATPYSISQRESIYLDFVRALAAFFVVLDHAPTLFDLPGIPRWGHQAVIVFFVLSGYVISNVADTRETNARSFLIARLARLWSVLVPAMALTVACDVVGRSLGHNPWAYAEAPIDWPLIRVGAIVTFLSESWLSIQPLSNGVVWSLCAEFWYYILFAAWTFVPPGRARKVALSIGVLLAGHKALLLSPIWLMGVGLQRSAKLRQFGGKIGVVFWGAGFLLVAWVLATHLYDPAIALMRHLVSPWIMTQLAQARVFWLDWMLGLAVALHLLGARSICNRIPLERIAAPIHWCASISFAAYLFHMPLLHFFAAFLPKDAGTLAIGLTFLVIALLGGPVEKSKRWWRWMLGWIADRLQSVASGLVLATRPNVGGR
ncbi:acyltransferase family protein [Rhodopila globiformis]|nr:acyltransferase [Rhodopila globiformis]